MAYYSKYTGAELEERLDKVEEIPQLIAQMITGKDFVTKEDLLCVLKDYAPADYRTIPIDNNTIYWENGVLKAATSDGTGQCQWELREHNGIQYLYSRLPVVTQYDVTMYADVNHLDLPSIYDGLPIDGDTIYWEETENGRILKSKYEGSSGVDASEVLSIVSNAGYATQNWVNNQNFISSSFLYTELAKYVKIKDYQEIEGVKNFLNGLQIAGLPITKLNGYEDVLYIDSNVVIRGGLTMYYEDGEINLPTIKDEIGNAGYDGVTGLASFNSSQFSISSDGTVTIIGGSTGLDTAQLKDYLDSNKYTTETWVKEQGYASASSLSSLQTKVNNFLEGSDTDTIINKWKELEIFLSGLSESDNLADILSAKANQSALDATNEILATKWTTDNNLINKWNTAYGWGNHASVGYALKSYVDNTFVTIKGNENVTGVHDFVNGLKIGNIKLSKSQEGVVYLEGNLVVKGGVTMYALDEVTVDSIIDSLPLASTSQYGIAKFNPSNFIINEDGFVTVIGGSGATVKYPLSWSGFNQGSYDGSVAQSFYIPTKLSEFVNDKDFVTKGTSLSHYGITNAIGYLSSIIADKADAYNLAGYGTTGGGFPINGGVIKVGINNYQMILHGRHDTLRFNTVEAGTLKTWRKVWHDGNFTPSDYLLASTYTASNILTKLKTVDGEGSGLESEMTYLFKTVWAASSSTTIDLNEWINGGFIWAYGYAENVLNKPNGVKYCAAIEFGRKDYNKLIGQFLWDVNHNSETDATKNLYFRASDTNGFLHSQWHTIAFTDSNVASATKLQTPRTIWGQSFDGTANIDGGFTLLDTARDSRPFRIGWLLYNERAALNMWSYSSSHGGFGDMCLGVSSDVVSQGSLYFNSSTKQWGVGTASPEYKFEVNGNISSRATTNVIRKFVVENNVAKASFYAATSGRVGIFEELLGQWLIVNNGGNTGLAIGNVGVGTLSPTYKLEVRGDIYSSTNVRTPIATIGGIPIYKSQDDVLYIDGNLVVRGGVTMYAENEVNIPSIIDSLPIASNTALGIASFDSTYFSVDSNGMVTLTSAPSSGASYLGELLNVDDSIDATASVDRILYQPQGSSMWTWRELPKDGVVGNYLPLTGGSLSGMLTVATELTGITINNTRTGRTPHITFQTKGTEVGALGISTSNVPQMYNAAKGTWHTILTDNNYSSYALPLSGGEINGSLLISNGSLDLLGAKNSGASTISFESNGDSYSSITVSRYGIDYNGVLSICPKGGMVGVGLTSPEYKFHVQGDIYSSGMVIANSGIDARGTSSYGTLPYIRLHIPGITYAQFLINGNGVVELRYGDNTQTGRFMSFSSGDILSSGGITMYSDQRKKTILNHVELSLKQIADAPLIEYYYNSDQEKTTHVGSIAQYWAELNDWFCKLDNEGYYTMEIQNCALASAISIARHLEKYESKTDKKIRQLKKRISQLEDELELLKKGV